MTTNSLKARTVRGNDIFGSSPRKKRGAVEKEAAPVTQIGAHGRYQIKSGRLGGEYVARAFPKPPARTRGLVAEATAATEEAAIEALHAALDKREMSRTGSRRTDANTGAVIPSVAEYSEAIRQVELSEPQRALLKALCLADDDGLAETRMARAAGYKSRASVRRSFAGAGLLIADFLSMETAPSASSQELEGTWFVGYRAVPAAQGDPETWILHRELREALRTSGE